MELENFLSGCSAVILLFNASIQEVKSFSIHRDVKINATRTPLGHSLNTMKVYRWNCHNQLVLSVSQSFVVYLQETDSTGYGYNTKVLLVLVENIILLVAMQLNT